MAYFLTTARRSSTRSTRSAHISPTWISVPLITTAVMKFSASFVAVPCRNVMARQWLEKAARTTWENWLDSSVGCTCQPERTHDRESVPGVCSCGGAANRGEDRVALHAEAWQLAEPGGVRIA